ncbi:integrase [Mycolicibacterium boenickei]|nr:integrase [Mycolicibacterium boenickei]
MSASARDIEDYEHWRRFAEENPQRVGGSKWDRELAAFVSLYGWAQGAGHVLGSPIAMTQVAGRGGTMIDSAASWAKNTRRSNVHWLTPRTWRLWMDVGLRGHDREGVPQRGWMGRLEDRNVAFVRLLTSSGLRRTEAGSLLTFEVPVQHLEGSRYYRGRVAAAVTRSKKTRTFYVRADAVGDIEAYMASSRAWAIRRAQRKGVYSRLTDMRLVTEVISRQSPIVRWVDRSGSVGERRLEHLTSRERMALFTEGPRGPEPLWLWLNERGLPFVPHSWEGVFHAANERCRSVLTPPGRAKLDPYQVFAPYATPHSARHSFALYMLVVLNTLMDQKFGLTPQERRDFQQLYGDPWFMVQNLLGHSSRETTVDWYLSPVADLQLQALLASTAQPVAAPLPELDATFARIARDSIGIQDVYDAQSTAEGGLA